MAVQAIAWLATLVLPLRVPQLLNGLTAPAPPQPLGPGVTPEHVSDIAEWAVDVAASMGSVLAPVAGLVLVLPATQSGRAQLSILYAASFVLAFALFIYVLTRPDAGYYKRRIRRSPFSPGVLAGLSLNAAALAIAVALAG